MKRIFWITPESFLDVDMPIIEELNSKFDIFWMIIGFDKSTKNMFVKSDVEDYANRIRLKYIIVSTKYRFRNPLILFFYLSIIIKINRFKTDILYTSYLGEPFFLLVLRKCFVSKKVIIAIHDVVLHSSEKKRKLKELYHNHIRRKYSNFHLFSGSQAELFSQTFRNKNILLTPLCIKDFGKPSFKNKVQKTRFLFFGSILPYKGLEVLIKALNYLISVLNIKEFTLTIAGNCNESDWDLFRRDLKYPEFIQAEIRTIKNSEIADLFSNSDYLVLPYKDVTQCGPLMIAFNYKVPVIASDLPGFRDYISEGQTGYLFKKNDYKKLADIMANCIQSTNREFLVENINRTIDEQFSSKVISEKYLQYFNSMVDENME